jgi:hypothetical protein
VDQRPARVLGGDKSVSGSLTSALVAKAKLAAIVVATMTAGGVGSAVALAHVGPPAAPPSHQPVPTDSPVAVPPADDPSTPPAAVPPSPRPAVTPAPESTASSHRDGHGRPDSAGTASAHATRAASPSERPTATPSATERPSAQSSETAPPEHGGSGHSDTGRTSGHG